MVSYNPTILAKYNCHANLDVVGSNAVVKYLFKYMNKGADIAYMRRSNVDGETENREEERVDGIKEFIQSRYMSGIQGAYMLSALHMHGIKPAVISLHCHTEAGFSIRYNTLFGMSTEEAAERQQNNESKTSILY